MSDLPRLLLCCFDVVPAPTAISRRMTEYLKGLSDRYQVVVLSVKTPDHAHIERYHGARLLRVPVGSGDLAARVQSFDRAVRRQLESEEYVMVHFFDPFGGYALCERRSELGYKLVYDACSLPSVDLPFLYDETEANRRFIARVRRQELFCLMNADVVIVANELTREFVTGLGVAREQVQVLPAPVDLGPYEPKVMGVPDATPMKLLHLGNLSSAQDLGTVLEAMQLALQTVDVHLTVVGPPHPEHQARLEEQVAALKLTGKVEFQLPVAHDDLHKVLATCDVGLLTLSDVERNSRVGSPLSRLSEYLAAGRPVIAADVAAARAVLPDDGVVLYRPQDKLSLADAICSLATEPSRRVKLGAAARAASLDRDGLKIRADLVATYVAVSGTGVRAIGDAELTSPDEVTQLGRSLGGEDTQRRKAAKAETDAASGTNKVKTDPAIAAEDTSPEGAMGDRPAVMGVPIREEEPPVVLGQEAREMAAELAAQVTTQPNANRPTEPPVVMGMPLPVSTSPSTLTPGDLAAELEDIPPAQARTSAPTGDGDTGPRHHLEDDLPDTGGHLSLVPRTPTPSDTPITAPTTAPIGDEPPPFSSSATVLTRDEPSLPESALRVPTPAVLSRPSPPLPAQVEQAPAPEPELNDDEPPIVQALGPAEPPVLTPRASPPPPIVQAMEPPPRASPPPPIVQAINPDGPPVLAPAPAQRPVLPPSVNGPPMLAPIAGPTPGDSSRVVLPPPSSPPVNGPPMLAPSPGPTNGPPDSGRIVLPPRSSPSVSGPPVLSPSPRASPIDPPASTAPSPPPAMSPPVFIPPLEMPRSGPSGLNSPPPLPRTASGVMIAPAAPIKSSPSGAGFVALLTPPRAPEPSKAPPPLPRTASGVFPVVPAAPRTSSGIFPVVPAAPRTSSGIFPVVPATPRTTTGGFPIVPALPRTASGLFPVVPAPSLDAHDKQASGLFPDPPRMPTSKLDEAEAISEDEIEAVGDEVEEVGADEIEEVSSAPAPPVPPLVDETPVMMAAEEMVMTVDTDASPPPSAIDPWLAQLVHGYCPPESGLFERHTPPTTMPGRDT